MKKHNDFSQSKKARNLRQQEPGQARRAAKAAACNADSHKNPQATTYHVSPAVGEPFEVTVSGRERWTLRQLAKAGTKGVASVESPAMRLAAYVCELRKKRVPIETLTEPHGGDFPGTHARYILRANVTKICDREQL